MQNDSGLEYTVELDGWNALDYDHSSWTATTLLSASDVSPKTGCDKIGVEAGAEMIWGPDLVTNNMILCRVTVAAP